MSYTRKIMHVLSSRNDGSMPYNLIYLPQSRRMKLEDPLYLCGASADRLENIKIKNDVVLHFHDLYASFRYMKNKENKGDYIITIHNDFWYLRLRNKIKLALLLSDIRCRRVIFCSKAAARGLDTTFRKVTFIDNGYPFSNQLGKQNFEKKEQDLLLFCKSNDYQKNNYELLEKLTDCGGCKLHLVGHVSSKLMQMIENSDLSVVSHGTLPRSQVENLQKKSRIVVSNSRYEGLPLAILESVNFGVMPLLSNIAAHRYMIPSHLHEYFIYSNVIRSDFERKLKNMLSQNELHFAFRELQKDLRNRFNQTKMLNEYDMVYSDI